MQLLEGLGHAVLTRHLVDDDARERDRLISAQYRRDMAWLQQCEVLIAEASGSSFGLGFETGYLLCATAKKVILFYRHDLEKKISLLTNNRKHAPELHVGSLFKCHGRGVILPVTSAANQALGKLQSSSNSGMSANAPSAKVVHGGSE